MMDARSRATLAPTFGRPHVVLLGAGASRAACPNGDRHGRVLPLMNDLVEVVGVAPILKGHPFANKAIDFESLYSSLVVSSDYDDILREVDNRVFDYFRNLELPDEPTLYDRMVLCLRHKDLIATFNWDPLLPQALQRVGKRFGQDSLPQTVYLHGNVAIGYCDNHERPTVGFMGNRCGKCGAYLSRSDMLFPVARKGYTDDSNISLSWEQLREYLGGAFILTVFGYSAPRTDVDAIRLMKEAWGAVESRWVEQLEIIDIRAPQVLYETWEPMICRDHYWVMHDFYQSLAAQHPRRSCEDFFEAAMRNDPQEDRPIPCGGSWDELERWVTPLLEQERQDKKTIGWEQKVHGPSPALHIVR